MKYQYLIPIKSLLAKNNLSERMAAKNSLLSRGAVRSVAFGVNSISLQTITKLCNELSTTVSLISHPEQTHSEFSTIAISYKVMRDGFSSWKIHFFDFVDEFRRTLDTSLILLAPSPELDIKLRALMSSIVLDLCNEAQMQPPQWARHRTVLHEPWFLAEVEPLKPMALVESPAFYKSNNIFVLSNFLMRA